MDSMPLARIHGPDDIRVDPVEIPSVGPQDVMIAVKQCGICGSDLSYARLGGLPGARMPMPIGHEFAGVVYRVGTAVKHLVEGDRVVVNPEADSKSASMG